jgi:predicted dinucleotide-binding enzyme
MKVAVIGKGKVGKAVALAKAGHDVAYGVRDPEDAKSQNGRG